MFISRRIAPSLLFLLASCSAPATPVTSQPVILPGGATVVLRSMGKGSDTIVVLPGGPAFGSRYLEKALAPLADDHTLLLLDLRGRGEAPVAEPESLSIAIDVRDLEAVREQLQLNRMRLLGHHWGAGVAMLYAVAHPDRTERIALVGPMPDGVTTVFEFTRLSHDSAALLAHAKALEAGEDRLNPDKYCRSFWGFAISPAEETDAAALARLAPSICDAPLLSLRARPALSQALYGALGTWEWRDTMRLVTAPALVVVGKRVTARTVAAELWAARMHDGRVLVLGETPWFPWVEAGQEFNRDLRQFFAGTWPEGAVRPDLSTRVSAKQP